MNDIETGKGNCRVYTMGVVYDKPALYYRAGLIMSYGKPTYTSLSDGSGIFGIVYNDSGTQAVDFMCLEQKENSTEYETKSILGHSSLQRKTYPKGVWDFSSCTVTGLDSTVAVFG